MSIHIHQSTSCGKDNKGESHVQMLGSECIASNRQTFSIQGCLIGSFRIKRFFFPLILFFSASFFVVFLSTPINQTDSYTAFDLPQSLLPAMIKQMYLGEIRYDEDDIFRRNVRENTLLNKKLWDRIKPAMSTSEKQTLRRILGIFSDVADSHNFTHFLISGTLLGSYRHHGLMPWDDDVDILMRFKERDTILEVFRNYSKKSEIGVATGKEGRMKIFHKFNSIAIKGWRYRWPIIDISFYHENDTHVWEESTWFKYHILPKTLVFPLHPRPFETLMMKSPRDAFAVLKLLYTDPTCVTLFWIHKAESRPGGISRFDCEIVSPFYPFVHREVHGAQMEESLVLNGTVLYRIPVDEPLYAISKPYVLELVGPMSSMVE